MLELTGAMRTELLRLADSLNPSHAAVRITRDSAGHLHLVPDALAADDLVLLQRDGLPPLICEPQLAEQAEGGILHFHALADERYDGAAVVLLRPRDGTPRPAWTPPQQTRPAPARDVLRVFGRGATSAPTTQSATP
jgi:hypothetical protein